MQREAPRTGATNLMEGLSCLVEMVHRNAGAYGSRPAFARKVDEDWVTTSYAELYDRVWNFAAGLANLGVERGARVALISRNRTKWPVSDFAIQSLGAATVPVYPTLEPVQVAHILADSDARVAIVEDEEQLRKVESVRERLPELREILVMEDGFEGEGDQLRRFRSVEEMGEQNPLDGWEDGWRSLGREDVATVIYTSGTTGLPKGVVLTHGNILSNLEGVHAALPVYGEDVFLSFLPLSHVFERTAGQFYAVSVGATTYYAESIMKVLENLREVRPTVTLSVPRLYEKMYDRVRAQVAEGSPLRRRLFEAAIEAGRRRYRIEREGGTVGGALALKLRVYDRLVFRKIQQAVGGRLRYFVSGGAKLNPEVGEFFYAAGVKIMEGYGLTETSPVISCNRLENLRFGTVGLPLHNVEVRISGDGEVQVRGPSVMREYLNNTGSTAEAFTEDGWFRTGDLGVLEEYGFLSITDRLKNLIVLSTGKNVAPQPVESALVTAPHISQSVLVGDGRKYISALIVPDYDAVRKTLGTDASNEEFSGDERVRDLVQRELDAATRDFAAFERPKRFVLLPRELSQEEGELTPTLKVKQRVVLDRYLAEIEKMYA